jgi:hypothetical protein
VITNIYAVGRIADAKREKEGAKTTIPVSLGVISLKVHFCRIIQ